MDHLSALLFHGKAIKMKKLIEVYVVACSCLILRLDLNLN